MSSKIIFCSSWLAVLSFFMPVSMAASNSSLSLDRIIKRRSCLLTAYISTSLVCCPRLICNVYSNRNFTKVLSISETNHDVYFRRQSPSSMALLNIFAGMLFSSKQLMILIILSFFAGLTTSRSSHKVLRWNGVDIESSILRGYGATFATLISK